MSSRKETKQDERLPHLEAALTEVEQIEKGYIPRKTGRQLLSELRSKYYKEEN